MMLWALSARVAGQGESAAYQAGDALGWLRAFAATLAVLGLIIAAGYLFKRLAPRLAARRGLAAVTVETAIPIGERRSLMIVAVEGRRLLLGATSAQVSLITELSATAPAFGAALDRASGDRPGAAS